MATVEAIAGQSGGIRLTLEEVEVALLQSLARQMVDFVGPTVSATEDPLAAVVGIDPLATTPDDPALLRLLPDAYVDDDEAAAEFRRFTERDLRERKAGDARAVLASLERADRVVDVVPPQTAAWLGFLNDARLTLGTRIGITEDNHDELAGLPDQDPRAGLFQVYDWLTFLQDSFVQRLMPDA